MEFVFWDSTLSAKIFLGEQFCCIYHSQRHNWPHILEIITRKFPKSRNIQNFQNRQSGMLSVVSVVCLTNQSSSTKSERNMVIKRSKKSDIILLQTILISNEIAGGPLLRLLAHPLVVSHRLFIRKACLAPACHLKCSHTSALICSLRLVLSTACANLVCIYHGFILLTSLT